MITKDSLKNQYGIVTGGGGLLAFEHACALLELSCAVVLIDIDKTKLKKNLVKLNSLGYSKIKTYVTDITSETKLLNLSKKLKNNKIIPNILINNAGLNYSIKNKSKKKKFYFENFDTDYFVRDLNIGLKGSYLCSKIFGNMMKKNGKGVILNIASDLSVIAPDQRLYSTLQSKKPVSYSIVKHGLIGLTKYLSAYWASENIRVNALSPGGIYDKQEKVFLKKIKKLIPLKRMLNREEIRATIQYLCTDDSSYMTGQNIILDGGRSIL